MTSQDHEDMCCQGWWKKRYINVTDKAIISCTVYEYE